MVKIVVVTGGRSYSDFGKVEKVLNELQPNFLYCGDAKGADAFSKDWAIKKRIAVLTFYAHWEKYGRSAGPIRNLEMLKAAGPNAILVAFPGGRGTANCVKQAKNFGMAVLEIE